eukprot:Clim_evm34s142 gene=Clim_evmTU34s142
MAETKLLSVAKSANETMALTHQIFSGPGTFSDKVRYVSIATNAGSFVLNYGSSEQVQPNQLAFNGQQRKWVEVSLGEQLTVSAFDPNSVNAPLYAHSMSVEVDFVTKAKATNHKFMSKDIATLITRNFHSHAFSVGEVFVADVQGHNLKFVVQRIDTVSADDLLSGSPNIDSSGDPQARGFPRMGILTEQSTINVTSGEKALINLVGQRAQVINPEWNFEKMGIGGLDNEFSAIFRRAFASRIFPVEVVEKLGVQHVKGILLFGPPGTGKTLMARQIGKMLQANEPKIVNGPEILSKYVGQAEENIRNLFVDAETEYKAKGDHSSLHIIIFDEIDAICKARGSVRDGSGVHDTVVNQLLSKIDGVEALNNILVIGMTNRKDMIDEALIRPGRLEVQMEISLPDEKGRIQILKIHTSKMRQNDVLDGDVDIDELAGLTKNFSGAEIEGLVKSATSFAFNRHVKANSYNPSVGVDISAVKITRNDFLGALDEVKPAYGAEDEELQTYILNDILSWTPAIDQILEDGKLIMNQARNSDKTPLVSVLLHGPTASGKTALAARLGQLSDFPYVKVISPAKLVGFSEAGKIQTITKIFDDAYKSQMSCIIVDDIERLLEYVQIGPRFSNGILQTLMTLLRKTPPKGRKLVVVGTTSKKAVMKELGINECFDSEIHVPNISNSDELEKALTLMNTFAPAETQQIKGRIEGHIWVGVKSIIMAAEKARQDDYNKVERFVDAISGGFVA